ncbi:hypothetical protein D9615_008239 [Tricholomella constricta]|uniref:Oxidoreductase AflY n=1 Tax=Tricholomella constricta TaxID=117010 RepID=A0A8H5LZL2_9AGAR|nr:hypothetical protein D9615_008239 [Tricholomella constricta]
MADTDTDTLRLALDDLYPAPAAPLTRLSPRTWPGITPQSTETLRSVLKDNQQRWHVFFDPDYRPHNHAVHYVLALWAMGADAEIIQAAYDLDCTYLLPRFESPARITAANYDQHFGDANYYSAYLDFFNDVVREKGVAQAVEEYVFDLKANFVDGKTAGQDQPEMLNRFMDGIIHPMIHVGNGLEFGLPGLVAEGLAWTAVHFPSSSLVIPASLWETTTTTQSAAQGNTHALTIISRIANDARFDAVPRVELYYDIFSSTTAKYSEAINAYVRAWSYDRTDPGEVERKIEELVWANTVIYAVGGWTEGEAFNADFFLAHLVTSSLFLSPIAAHLTPASQELLCRSYFAVCLTWWIGRGRPTFDIPSFFASTSLSPSLSPPSSSPPQRRNKHALPSPDSPKALTPNAWLQLVQESLTVPDEHLPKTLRALAHFADIYGRRPRGDPVLVKGTELEGKECLDGTLFVRAAVLTNEKLRGEKAEEVEFKDAGLWERRGFYKSSS